MKITLGEISEVHADLIAKWKSDKELAIQIMSQYQKTSVVEAREWIRQTLDNAGQKLFGIFVSENNGSRLVGVTRLMYIDLESKTSEFGMYIGEKNVHGKGVGKIALRLTLQFGFEKLGLRKIHLRVNTNNDRAIKLYQNQKFVTEGVLKEHFFNNGNYEDILLMGLFKKDFE